VDELTRLATRARDGDRRALETFVVRSQADVWRLCCHLGGRQDADDLTQATYLRAWTALPRFRAESSARTWLLSIARRVCVDHIRGIARRRRIAERLAGRPVSVSDHSGATDLELALASLDPDRQAAFVLTQVLGLPYHDTAQVLGCPIGTVRSRVARAREDLIGQLAAGELFGDS
jgi:RNA polymerase sigma-70 factor (ECF subfamily)